MIKRMVLLAFLTLGVFASLGEQVEAQNIKTFKEPPFEDLQGLKRGYLLVYCQTLWT